ncbi:tRNA (guanine(10)-N2)-methyltransferase homolog isoform X2 [Prorops nasuta]|uniref:tRNA (guanine(10)-N2)-methyltransferase homolog isoform X2 n=1 Tax=Prorops nasuta TaxID=863751 RepID=UPI0034CF885F
MSEKPIVYLFWFAHEHLDFRRAEINSILEMYNINIQINAQKDYPYWLVTATSEDAIKKVANRAVSLRFCLELWASSEKLQDLHNGLRLYPLEKIRKHITKDKSFKVSIETFCKHFSQAEKIKKIESFSYLPLEGPVKLKNPDTTLCYIEFYGLKPNNIPDEPYMYFFGRLVANGQRELIQKLSLKNRNFIGNTSMDAQLSIIMANQANVKSSDLVLDPFVGSGSLLVAAAYFGGYTLGTDIDFLMLHGRTRPTRITQKVRGKDDSIIANMNQYELTSYHLDVLVSDFSRPMWHSNFRVDAIITDPPYGIRESTERIGTTKKNLIVDAKQMSVHIPSKINYELPQIFKDLLIFSARHLKLNGRLRSIFRRSVTLSPLLTNSS